MYAYLARKHAEHGSDLQILLYPSDEFGGRGGQELPNERIPEFVRRKGLPTDGGGCILMEKCRVNGGAAPAWKHAKAAFPGEIQWNFEGIFVFDESGTCVGRFGASDAVVGSALDQLLEKLLA